VRAIIAFNLGNPSKLGDPLEVRAGEAFLLLRKEEAQAVMVEALEEA